MIARISAWSTRRKIIVGAITAFLLLILIGILVGDPEPSTPAQVNTQSNQSAPSNPAPPPASKFNCRDLELEFKSMEALGYDVQLQHVSTVMALKDSNALAYYTSGDAERELQRCGVIR